MIVYNVKFSVEAREGQRQTERKRQTNSSDTIECQKQMNKAAQNLAAERQAA